jgi:multiple sugar transport system ATP-binding protein
MAGLCIRDLVKADGAVRVLHAIHLELEDGEFVVLVGPSCCGKSTTVSPTTAAACPIRLRW